MHFVFKYAAINAYSERAFKIKNEALAIACGINVTHPYFEDIASNTKDEETNTIKDDWSQCLLRFHILELYFEAHPEYQKILEKFVAEKQHEKTEWQKRLRSWDKNPLRHILPVLREYDAKQKKILVPTKGYEDRSLVATKGHEDRSLVATKGQEDRSLVATKGHEDHSLVTTKGHEVHQEEDLSSSPSEKLLLALKMRDIGKNDTIKGSAKDFWEMRRIKQQLECLSDKDFIKKFVQDEYVRKESNMNFTYPTYSEQPLLERFVDFLKELDNEENIQRELKGIENGNWNSALNVLFFGPPYNTKDFKKGLLANINKYQDDFAFNLSVIAKSGTDEQKNQLLTLAKKRGYTKDQIIGEDEIKEVVNLLAPWLEESRKKLQDKLDKRLVELRAIPDEKEVVISDEKAVAILDKKEVTKDKKEGEFKFYEFTSYPDVNELRRQYKKLALIHHTDIGGEKEKENFQQLRNEYDELLRRIQNGEYIPLKNELKTSQTHRTFKESKAIMPPKQSLAHIFQDSTLSEKVFKDKVRGFLHDTCIDKTNLNPIPSLIKMLKALDDAYNEASSKQYGQSPISRKNLLLLKAIYLEHLREIQQCKAATRGVEEKSRVVQKHLNVLDHSQIAFVETSPLLMAETALVGFLSKSEKGSISEAKKILTALGKSEAPGLR